jgi:hypothetical protein
MWSSSHPLPNADAAVWPVAGTRPELTPVADHYRIDINTISPRVDGAAWRLRLHGLVGRPLDLSLDEIRRAVDARQLAAYAGLTPRERSSGSSVNSSGRRTKHFSRRKSFTARAMSNPETSKHPGLATQSANQVDITHKVTSCTAGPRSPM